MALFIDSKILHALIINDKLTINIPFTKPASQPQRCLIGKCSPTITILRNEDVMDIFIHQTKELYLLVLRMYSCTELVDAV